MYLVRRIWTMEKFIKRRISFQDLKRTIQVTSTSKPSFPLPRKKNPVDPIERGNNVMSKRSSTKPPIKRIADRRKLLAEKQHSEEMEKKKMVNNLISDLLDQAYTGGILPIPECSALDRRVPKSMPAPNGFISSLDAEDESLFRYFCFGKPSVWISTKKFNRDIPWCLVFILSSFVFMNLTIVSMVNRKRIEHCDMLFSRNR